MSGRRIVDLREGLRTAAVSTPIGLAIGAFLRLTRAVPETVPALLIPTIFWTVMWPGFETFGPWIAFGREDPGPPSRIARRRVFKVVLLYTALMLVSWLLVFATTGLSLGKTLPSLLISYLIGLCVAGLLSSFHTMANLAEMERERARAEADGLRKTEELEQARELQLSMLPSSLPEMSGLDVAFGMRTATEVGGDYYDYRIGENGTLDIAVGDATGHGVRAGLLVVAAKTLFQTGGGASLTEEIQRVNAGIRSLHLVRMNMALALVSVRGELARVAAGGMPPVLHFRAATGSIEEVLLQAPPPGQMRRAMYAETAISLAPGDRLLLFTDGLPECRDAGGQLFGYDRVTSALVRHASAAPRDIIARLFAEADAFVAGRPYEDDMTLAVIGVKRWE